MLNKKILILAIFFVSLLAVSAVSAADNATNDVVEIADDVSDDEMPSDDFIQDSDDELMSSQSEDILSKKSCSISYDRGIATLSDNEGNNISDQILSFEVWTHDEEDNQLCAKYSRLLTDENGQAEFSSAGIAKGTYVMLISYDGNDQYKSAMKRVKLTVTKYVDDDSQVDSNSLTALDNLIKNTQGVFLNLNDDYGFVSVVNGFSDTRNSIKITKSIVIDGNGHTIDGGNATRIFEVSSPNVILKNIIFKNCKDYVYYGGDSFIGGAVYWHGDNGNLINCTFINCRLGGVDSEGYQIQGFGGAVCWNAQNGEISDCNFINNNATCGGAVCWEYGYCNIINCNFTNNTASLGNSLYCSDQDGRVINSNIRKSDIEGGENLIVKNTTDQSEIIFNKHIKSSDATFEYGGDSCFKVRIVDDDGDPVGRYEVVGFMINGIPGMAETDSDGYASFNVNNLNAGKHEVTITYNGETAFNTIVINPKSSAGNAGNGISGGENAQPTKTSEQKITLALKKVTVKKSAKKLVLQATLKKGKTPLKNKKITFKFNGKKYTAKTNKKGVAKVTIKKAVLKKLKVGKKVKYQASYGSTIVKKTVKVKK